jgi:RiboL-PSP-HEPN
VPLPLEVTRYRMRLDHLFAKIDEIPSGNIELESHWARYLCVLVAGYVDVGVQEIHIEYARQHGAAPAVLKFVESRLRRTHNFNMDDLIQLVGLFDPIVAAELRVELQGEPKDSIDSINNNRNLIAHGADVGITYVRIKRYYEDAQAVVTAVATKYGLI